MNPLLDDDEVLEREHHEVTLGTGLILGLFFALVLLCGLFFGFGYKMGSHKTAVPGQAVVAENAPAAAASSTFSNFKPAAGSPVSGSGGTAPAANADAPPAMTRAERRETERLQKEAAAAANREPGADSAHAATTAVPAGAPGGAFVVQVAAVSHEQDAELLVNALKAKGYPVSAHTEPQDKFFHIQVGPFATHQDADVAKQKLLADGYQPIVK